MTKRVVLIVLGAVLLSLGALTAIGGGVVMALFGSSDTVNSGVHQVSTPARALVSPVAAIQDTTGVQTAFGNVRLHITATPAGTSHRIFIGIGPAAAVDRYLSGVSHDVATDVTLTPFHLTRVHHPGAAQPAPPGSQSFWVAHSSGDRATLSWTVTDGSYRVVAMNADGTAAVSFNSQLGLTIPHMFAIGTGLLIGGLVLVLLGGLLLVLGIRARPRHPGTGSPHGMPDRVGSAPYPSSQAGPAPHQGAPADGTAAPSSIADP
jgi:hypothetical protein